MSEIIDRVADAIKAAINDGAKSDFGTATFPELARAAIAAMREPTEAMIQRAREERYLDEPHDTWQSMIDAALDKHP
jgi:hypothetical protein